jgi:transposase
MARLERVSADELREYLDEVTEKRPTLRLVVGINYKEGVSQSALADWYAISRTTVHNWLNRLERLADEPFEDVIFDADRSGRPPKLTTDQWDELVSILHESPTEIGIDAPHWSPRLVQILIDEKFDVEYSRRHVRELLNRAGFTWKTARLQFTQGDERARKAFREGFKKTDAPE